MYEDVTVSDDNAPCRLQVIMPPMSFLESSVIKSMMPFAILQSLAGICPYAREREVHVERGVFGTASVSDSVTYCTSEARNAAPTSQIDTQPRNAWDEGVRKAAHGGNVIPGSENLKGSIIINLV